MLDFQRERLIEIKSKQNELDNFIDTLSQSEKVRPDKFHSIKTSRQTGKILRSWNRPQPNRTLRAVMVNGANWFPTYDIRVDDISQPMVIEYKTNIQQNSGEDWKNIHLDLSNGAPSTAIRGTLETWFLSPYVRIKKIIMDKTGTRSSKHGNYARIGPGSGKLLMQILMKYHLHRLVIGIYRQHLLTKRKLCSESAGILFRLTIQYLGYQTEIQTFLPGS
jgi:hypothetical protein